MPIADIKEFCKNNNVPMTAVKCNPHYDEKKGRVTKGNGICHSGWKEKGRFEVKNTKTTPGTDDKATMWMMSLKTAKMYVIDIDVIGNKKAVDIMKPEYYSKLYDCSKYVIETGSGGLHFYFKVPETSLKLTLKTKVEDCNDWFIEGESGSVDFIFDAIITEGSTYTYNNKQYKYINIKQGSSIEDTRECEGVFAIVAEYFKTPTLETSTNEFTEEFNLDEIKEHLENIPNDKAWDDWEKMGQLLYNISKGSNEGYELFKSWSSKNQNYNELSTFKLWKGLKIRTENVLTIGSLFYLSKSNDETKYNSIRNKYDLCKVARALTHYDVAKYFYNYKPYSYIYKSEYGWFSLLPNNTWYYSEKEPILLLKDIAETIIPLVNKKINSLNKTNDKDDIKALGNLKRSVGTTTFCNGVIKFLQTFYLNDNILKLMDESKHLFAFNDKVVDLDANIVRDIKPTDYISITTGYNYPTKSDSKIRNEIYKFLYSIFENNEMVQFEIDKMSYVLHGNKKFEVFVIETGIGRNGKGSKSKLVQQVLGNYYVSIPISTFTKPNDKKDAPNPALVSCRGKRFIESQEPEKTDKLQVGMLKEMTGNDILTCRSLFGKPIQFISQALISIQLNGNPTYNKIDNAITMRNIIQPFPFQFVNKDIIELQEHQRYGDSNIKQYISSIEWRNEYILMLLENYQKIKNKQLSIPNDIKDRTEQNIGDNIPIKEWVDEHLIAGSENMLLKDIYKKYCEDIHTNQISDKYFPGYLQLLGYNSKRSNKGICITNVMLK